MQVELLTYTAEPERVAATAARLCYSSASISQLLERSPDDHAALLAKILDLGHFSVLEHASFTFGIEGISRACSHQLVRHRIASYSQQSQRYVTEKGRFAAVTPPSIAAHADLAGRFEQQLNDCQQLYGELIAAGIPAEDARFVLPNAAATKLVMTMNARELRHFFSLRCCQRAQWEIREMATAMLRVCKPVAPLLFADAGPGCVSGPCPEGKMTCGRIAAIRREFKELT